MNRQRESGAGAATVDDDLRAILDKPADQWTVEDRIAILEAAADLDVGPNFTEYVEAVAQSLEAVAEES